MQSTIANETLFAHLHGVYRFGCILEGIMNHTQVEWWSFVWSEARLVIAAVALFIGGVPPALFVAINVPGTLVLVNLGLKLAWLISGATSLYLAYRWFTGGQTLFGKKETLDMVAFFVMVVSGLNLGLAGLMGQNIGMSISSNYAVFIATAVVYLIAAVYLYQRWSSNGQRLS
jgi:hypothetical protein